LLYWRFGSSITATETRLICTVLPTMVMPEQSYFPISELSSYQAKWTICARVTNKSQMRTFSGRNGNAGKVFSVDLLDAAGGEIRASFFNVAAEQWGEKMQKGKCYTFSRGNIKVANRQYNNTSHRYELVFDAGAAVEEAADDSKIEAVKFSITNLRSVQSRALPCTVDVCGVVVSYQPPLSFTSSAGKELVKREVTIADETAMSLVVTLWGDRAKQNDSVFEGNPVVALKGVNIKEWMGGRAGSLLESGAFVCSPDIPEVQRTRSWWEQTGQSVTLTNLSQQTASGGGRAPTGKLMSLDEVRRASERVLDQPELFGATCRLALVQTTKQGETQPLFYMACQEPKDGRGLPCNRRVDESGFCATCSRAGKCAPRLNLRCRFSDFGDSLWLTTFHEPAQRILAMTGDEVKSTENGEGGREALESAVRNKYFSQPYQITVRAKLDMYNGEPRTNITCIDARPVPRGEHGRFLLKEIDEMLSAMAV